MKRQLLISILVLGVVLLAIGGWAVDGLRWTLAGGRRRSPALAY